MKLIISELLLLIFTITVFSLYSCEKIIPDDPNSTNNQTPGPTPVGSAIGTVITKNIGSGGGTIASDDGNVELIFPAGALAANTDISIQPISNNAPGGFGNAYRFLPDGVKFATGVTAKFHYTPNDLAETLADLMGIAFQDSAGIWYRINNFTNDTLHKTISATITHFSDWSAFEIMRLSPVSTFAKVNNSVNLEAVIVDIAGNDDDELAPIFKNSSPIKWSANGILNGNSTVGTLTAIADDAVYTAPAKAPSDNPVAVSAELPFKHKYHGKTFDDLKLVSSVTVIDGEKYFLEMRITESFPPLTYTDSVNMIVVINTDDQVIISDIKNFAPKSTPLTARLDPCTATWVPDGIGETNVTSVTGTITGSPGDTARYLILTVTNSGAVSPKYTQACDGADPVTSGGIPFTGLPAMVFFTLKPGQEKYEEPSAGEFDRLTLIK